MFLIEEHQELKSQIENDPEVLIYAEKLLNDKKRSWFRLNILDPILKPIIEKVLKEYGELILRKAIEYLLKGGKL